MVLRQCQQQQQGCRSGWMLLMWEGGGSYLGLGLTEGFQSRPCTATWNCGCHVNCASAVDARTVSCGPRMGRCWAGISDVLPTTTHCWALGGLLALFGPAEHPFLSTPRISPHDMMYDTDSLWNGPRHRILLSLAAGDAAAGEDTDTWYWHPVSTTRGSGP